MDDDLSPVKPDMILCAPWQYAMIQEIIAEQKRWREQLFTPEGLHALFTGWPTHGR